MDNVGQVKFIFNFLSVTLHVPDLPRDLEILKAKRTLFFPAPETHKARQIVLQTLTQSSYELEIL
jgi:hypothetical protein